MEHEMIASDQSSGWVHEKRIESTRFIKRNGRQKMPRTSAAGVCEDRLGTLPDVMEGEFACSSDPGEIGRWIMLHGFDHQRA